MSLSSRGHMDPYRGDPDLDHHDMTPEQCKQYQIAFDAAMPKLDSTKGTVLVFGTGGDTDKGDPEWVAMYQSRQTTEQMQEEVGRIAKYYTLALPIWWEEK